MTASTEQLARRVCESWPEFTPDDFREIFAEDCAYQNMPMPGVNRGPDAVAGVLSAIGNGYEIKLRIDNLVASADLVMVERVESFTKHDGSGSFELPVMGVFEASGGKITAWRDYFHFDPKLWEAAEA
jgi:limonene-1,2-epoxide hydrolase